MTISNNPEPAEYGVPEVSINLGGKHRLCRLDLNVMVEIEEAIGRPYVQVFRRGHRARVNELRTVMYHLLRVDDPKLTIEEVGSWLTMAHVKRITEVMVDLMPWKHKDERILAPYVPTPDEAVRRLFQLAGLKKGQLVYDLGCGLGNVLLLAAREFGAKGIGVELDDARFERCRKIIDTAVWESSFKLTVLHQHILESDVSRADLVFVYLLPMSNERIRGKLEQEVKVGATVVSHDFEFHWQDPCMELVCSEVMETDIVVHTLYVYRKVSLPVSV